MTTVPIAGLPGTNFERTFIAIKPDGVQRAKVGDIMARFENKGFKLVALKMLTPTKEKAAGHYADLSKKPFFQGLVDYFSSGPVVAMVWEGLNAVAGGRTLLGATNPKDSLPGTIRGDLCIDIGRNICHGSDSADSAKHEIEFWFEPGEVQSVTSHSHSWVYEKGAEVASGNDNVAFVFIKPHAVTDATKALVKKQLAAKGMTILTEGSISSKEIDEKLLIDQHYYSIASKATILKPSQLNVPEDKFKEKFGIEWKAALKSGNVMNARDACETFGVDADELEKHWRKTEKMVKFGGGFYCALMNTIPGKPALYVFNGFFMSMRSQFTAPGKSIYYYTVSWDSKDLSWSSFRGDVLGPTDPSEAPVGSLRGIIMQDWKALGLKSAPNKGDNGVHASASPFEGLAERMNWAQIPLKEDPFGAKLLAAGIPADVLMAWSVDPQVTIPAGGKGSLFDALEDSNASVCLDTMVSLHKLQ